ncbi:type I polyketide synthase [Trichlorobacter lovleyi]|uniref:beta-ketoacyl synthase N-terminal-like domain-containing protein n=1 Tax=Trichlorobacter lovleyi TaxID=313985 RepID=UPI00223FBA87|nr:beta-ketoacyl synthase N-terminal-like domain-containing protein [Trichlorobacter lovleyi]QOX79304.1 type I polyketide synthase [Trichlorobacter lovleyi]
MQDYSSTVAIVGIGALFPDAPDLIRYWELIRSGNSAVREVPPGRWQVAPEELFDPEVGKQDHLYTTRGCFLDQTPQLPELDGLDPLFHVLVSAGRKAFSDSRTADLDLSRVGVIIGNLALPSETSSLLARNWLGRSFEEQVVGQASDPIPTSPLNRYLAGLPAGVLAQQLGLGGVTNTLDAACASSLYAIKLAMDELLSGRADAMLTGGLSRPDPLYTQMGFSQLRALSKRGICSPFDAAGDGLLTGEGAGIFLLKRTSDAVASGDRIYGVIRAVGLSNDVGGSLLAPMSEGQLRAMRAAYQRAGWQPQDVDLIECHATGTPVGDAVEVASLKELWQGSDSRQNCVIGSVKSNIGHLLTAAGAAALTKVLLAMQHATLPPTANFSVPQPGMQLEQSPFKVLTRAEPWQRRGETIPRRAAVSAFGFGGINAHLLVEEWLPRTEQPTSSAINLPPSEPIAIVGLDASFGPWQGLQAVQQRVLGGSSNAVAPTTPDKRWWGVEQRAWFKQQGLDRTPFTGWFMDQVRVGNNRFRIPPKEMEEMQPQQLLMLQTAANALQDAGLDKQDNPATGVMIGIAFDLNSTGFSLRWPMQQQARIWADRLGRQLTENELADWTARLRDSISPALNANRTMGSLGNIVASRIAREFKIGGPSFTLSSEESSGIRALETAVRMLQQRELDQAVVGAVDLAGDLRAVLGQHAVRPFSASGQCRPFDSQADGTVIGEGACAFVLKRLSDAEAAGNRIYAVIRGIGSSNGTPPSPPPNVGGGWGGYNHALQRAYQDSGVAPASIDLLEATADANPEQDRLEAEELTRFFADAADATVLGSVKGAIGHTGAVSGLASLLRGCLALYQEIIPAAGGTETACPELANGPLQLATTPRYWLRNREAGPRRAGVSVCGVDGSCSHVVLEGWDQQPAADAARRHAPLGPCQELLFPLVANSSAELSAELDLLQQRCRATAGSRLELAGLASEYCSRITLQSVQPQGMALVAADADQLEQLIEQGRQTLRQAADSVEIQPGLRDRLFYSREPLVSQGRIAFVFPGSGNHYPAMARDLFCCWPEVLRQQDTENRWLKNQFQPDLFWSGNESALINDNHRAVIFGQVATGCGVSDLVRSFGISPGSVIGYSLGESAALFSTRTWVDRDLMYSRMQQSTLFTHDLAGECRAARTAWGLPDDQQVNWSLGVVMAPADQVRAQLSALSQVYLLIINTPDECVVGGDSAAVAELVSRLGCHFFPLYGVTTVHCEVARPVATPYHDLHLFTTSPPPGVTFYSGAKGDRFEPTRENCAAAILDQALHGIDYPATIEAAYRDGVRLFLEMGPGNSCSRMISRILDGRPHLARSACFNGQDQVLTLLRLLASLIAERVPLDLSPLCMAEPLATQVTSNSPQVRLAVGGKPFHPPQPPVTIHAESVPSNPPRPSLVREGAQPVSSPPDKGGWGVTSSNYATLLQEFSQAQAAQIAAHEAFLNLSNSLTQSMAQALVLQAGLQQALGDDAETNPLQPANPSRPPLVRGGEKPLSAPDKGGWGVAFNREMCLEFAIGKVSTMLGPQFAEVDSFPTRVRLPDEPLMLVDRIIRVEGEPRSMTNGRVITEHDIFPHAWYLDGGRIPTCIAVEAGQADLFLSGYLGIDFITRGLAVYRLLDAVVTFHRGLPGPGETINYDIRIERFFRQGDTWLFRFFFEATVAGEPLLSMRDGCAGFFSSAALEAGKGIVRPLVDPRPTTGIRPADWQDLVPLKREGFTAEQLDKLRQGDLAGCFGPLFSGLAIKQPLTIPGNRMRLVHRVNEIIPHGGRYGQGMIRAEADIHPDDWFITCHFVDDRVMPGTLMYECCMHTLRILLLRIGWVAEASHAVWEPVPGVASKLCCRGQVLETTKVVTYEVTIREIGYRPEPYVIVDALMYADGKPIVEITSMSARLTGTTRQQLEQLWQGRNSSPASYIKPAIYTKEQILAYSNGNPSEGFGDRYLVFDQQRKIARLPGPPFQFMDRVTAVTGEPWQMKAGAAAEAQYDLPSDAWFFGVERQPRMPFCVLLEAALQPCGWLAAYVGSALTTPNDISFRNLGGSAIQHRPVTPDSGTLTCSATMTKVATSGGMIIQEFDFSVADSQGLIYEGQTMFGFFSKEALANQVGIRDAQPYQPSEAEIDRGRSLDYPTNAPFPDRQLRMIDRIELYVADGGPAGLGYLQGIKQVDPEEWFFKAHFFEDPVTPGSLGLESFQQLLKFAAVERWGWQEGTIISSVALQQKHRWLYRGQVVPSNKQVRVTAWITAVDDQQQLMTASGFLAVDDKLIYQMIDFTVRMESLT